MIARWHCVIGLLLLGQDSGLNDELVVTKTVLTIISTKPEISDFTERTTFYSLLYSLKERRRDKKKEGQSRRDRGTDIGKRKKSKALQHLQSRG